MCGNLESEAHRPRKQGARGKRRRWSEHTTSHYNEGVGFWDQSQNMLIIAHVWSSIFQICQEEVFVFIAEMI